MYKVYQRNRSRITVVGEVRDTDFSGLHNHTAVNVIGHVIHTRMDIEEITITETRQFKYRRYLKDTEEPID